MDTCSTILHIHAYTTTTIGIYIKVLEDLADKMQGCDGSTVDEMKIKDDLVYNKHTGQINGNVNPGSTEQQLFCWRKKTEVDQALWLHTCSSSWYEDYVQS